MAFPWWMNLSQLPWYVDLLQRCRPKLRQSYSYTFKCTTLSRTTPTCSHNFPHPGRIACCSAPNSRPPATKALHTIFGNNTRSSWWWVYKCPKHVDQIISAIKHSVASSWFPSLHQHVLFVTSVLSLLSRHAVAHLFEARGGAIVWGTTLQAVSLRVQFPMVLWPWGPIGVSPVGKDADA